MDFLTDFRKLFGKKIISYFIWLYIYCFLTTLDSNFFTCSYLREEISNIENNMYYVLLFVLFIIVYSYNMSKPTDSTKVTNYINIRYLFLLLHNQSSIYISKLLWVNFFLAVKSTILSYKDNYLVITIYSIILKISSCMLLWFPIYKSYSIFGFYKSTRLKYVDLKNENLKRLKY